MRTTSLLAAAVILSASLVQGRADEMVPISKERLQELERKAAELDRIKQGEKAPVAQPPSNPAVPVAPAAPQAAPVIPKPAPQVVTPPVSTLPAFEPGAAIDAATLAAHFKSDLNGAIQRYKGKKLTMQGEISGFDNTMFVRSYKIVFRPAGVDIPVVCEFFPAAKYKAVFPADDGTKLVGTLANDQEVVIAKTGQQVTVEGECKGFARNSVRLTSCKLK